MRKFLMILGGFILLGAGLSAQTISLDQARVFALLNSRSLVQYNLDLRNSILSENDWIYSLLPTLSASYRISMNYLDNSNSNNNNNNWRFIDPLETLSANATFSISISQAIFDGGRTSIQRIQSSIATESARKNALAEYYNVLDEIDRAYYAVLEATANLEAAESSLQNAVFSLSMAEIRQEGGIINQGDYLKALADKEASENSRNQARRNLTLNMARFRTLTGISDAIELEEIDFSPYEDVIQRLAGISDEEFNTLYNESFKILVAVNPTLARYASNSQIAEKNVSLAIRNFFPTLSIGISLSTGIEYSSRSKEFTTTRPSGSITISGSIPLDFWVLSDRLAQSKIARDTAVLNYSGQVSNLESNLQSALFDIFTQAESVLSSRRSLEYTEKIFEYAMERYRLSQNSVSDFGSASSSFINSRNSYTRAYYGFLRSLSSLRSLLAIDDEERLIALLMGS
jgi:outer membrane protein TolC